MVSKVKKEVPSLPEHDIYHDRLKVEELNVDPEVQRQLLASDWTDIKRMAASWDDAYAGTIEVNMRIDGSFYVMDGQRRMQAARLAEVKELDAKVHLGLTMEEEAGVFIVTNRDKKGPSQYERFRISCVAGIKSCVEIRQVLASHDLTMGPHASVNKIGCVAAIEKIYERGGSKVLNDTLTVAEGAWGRMEGAWDSVIVTGVGLLLVASKGQIKLDQLVRRLGKKQPHMWIAAVAGRASGVGGGSAHGSIAVQVFLEAYNHGRNPENRVVL